MTKIITMDYDHIFAAYYALFRADSDTPASTDGEYLVGLQLANEAINYHGDYEGTYWNELFDTNRVDGSGTQTLTSGTTIYSAPTNFREAGGFIKVIDSNGNEVTRYPLLNPQEAQFQDAQSQYAFFTSSPIYYSTGVASQSTTIITGVGTTFTAAMVGMEFVFASGESAGTITEFTDTTHLTVATTQTVASATFKIISRGNKLHINPAPTAALDGKYIDYVYYKYPTLFTDGTSTTEMKNPYFIVHRMLAMQFRAARNPYYSSALKDSENTIRLMQLDNNSGSWDNPPSLTDNSGTTFGG